MKPLEGMPNTARARLLPPSQKHFRPSPNRAHTTRVNRSRQQRVEPSFSYPKTAISSPKKMATLKIRPIWARKYRPTVIVAQRRRAGTYSRNSLPTNGSIPTSSVRNYVASLRHQRHRRSKSSGRAPLCRLCALKSGAFVIIASRRASEGYPNGCAELRWLSNEQCLSHVKRGTKPRRRSILLAHQR